MDPLPTPLGPSAVSSPRPRLVPPELVSLDIEIPLTPDAEFVRGAAPRAWDANGMQRISVLTEATGSVLYEREIGAREFTLSPSVHALLGYQPPHLTAVPDAWWMDHVHAEDHDLVTGRWSDHRPGHPVRWHVEYRVRRHDGSWALVRDEGRSLDATTHESARAVGVVTDVTQARTLHAQLQHLQRLEMVGRLTAGVAHDFNNVLAAIGGFTAVLRATLPRDDPRTADLQQIEGLVGRATDLTKNLLGLTRRRIEGRPRHLDVAMELRRLVPTMRILIGPAIALDVDGTTASHSTPIDPGLFDQVILNLTANARDATPDGGRIGVRSSVVRRDGEARVRVEVSDSGTGIAPDILDRIFQPFFTTKEAERGTGLGLWLAKEIIEAAGGTLTVRTERGRGTTFTLDLPGALEPPSVEPPPAPLTAERANIGKLALLIEDDDAVRFVTRRLLERGGFRVLTAENGEQGLRVLADRRTDLHVIVSDLHMPGLSGAALVQRLRTAAPEVGCLIVSGLTERLDGIGAEANTLSILRKPFNHTALVDAARDLATATVARRLTVLLPS